MKILWLTRRGEGCVGGVHKQYEFEQEVGRHVECRWAGWGWPLHKPGERVAETVSRLMPEADWVIKELKYKYESSRQCHYKIGVFITDLHANLKYKIGNAQGNLDRINKAGYDAIFLRYKYLYGTKYSPDLFLKKLKAKVLWIPWSIDADKFHPLTEKKFDASFIGITGRVYPLRNILWSELPPFCEKHNIKLLRVKPPGWGPANGDPLKRRVRDFEKNPKYIVGQRYVETLGRTRMLLFGSSIYRYPLQKYFEGLSSGCLVMADEPSTAKELGLKDDFNYVKINKDNWKSRLLYYLENRDEANRIAERGRAIILQLHTHKIRATTFLDKLREF